MLAYWFRVVDPVTGPTWVGLAVGRNKEEVMSAIDQHVDPLQVEIMPAGRCSSFCIKLNQKYTPDSDDSEVSPFALDPWRDGEELLEVGEGCPDFPVLADKRWRKPTWTLADLYPQRRETK